MRLVVAGAAGRMGKLLVRCIHERPEYVLAGALERPGSDSLGRDAGEVAGVGALGVPITDDPLSSVLHTEAIIDFTAPQTTAALSVLAAQGRVVHVVGTTGLGENEMQALAAAARHAVVIQSGNMSLGVNLLAGLVERAARSLGDAWDVEIVEMHHRMKVDAPSGTALMLGEAAARGRRIRLQDHSVRTRDGQTGPRPAGGIGFASLRGGTVTGDHVVVFAGAGERLEFVHRAEDRSIFAEGALQAARWGRDRKPGLYAMSDVLGLSGS